MGFCPMHCPPSNHHRGVGSDLWDDCVVSSVRCKWMHLCFVCVHARVCVDVGALARLFFLQTSEEQTQETSECVAIFWVSLHFCNTQLLQSANCVHFGSLPHWFQNVYLCLLTINLLGQDSKFIVRRDCIRSLTISLTSGVHQTLC